MGAPDVVGALDRRVAAEQVIGRYGGGFASAFADAGDFGDRLQPRPSMLFLQPADIGRDEGFAGRDRP